MRLQGEIATPQALAQRVEDVERRLERWSSTLDTAWKAVLGVVVAAALGWLLAMTAGVFDGGAARKDPSPANVSSTTATAPATAATVP